LLNPSARLRDAAAVVLAKNRFKGNILTFLSQKYGVSDHLLAVLKVINGIISMGEVQRMIGLLNAFDAKEIAIDKDNIINALVTYHAPPKESRHCGRAW